MNQREAKRWAASIIAAEIRAYLDAPGHYQEVIDGHWTEADHDRIVDAMYALRAELRRRAGEMKP